MTKDSDTSTFLDEYNRVFFFLENCIFTLIKGLSTEEHCHHAVMIIYGIEEPLEILINDKWEKHDFFIVDKDSSHKIKETNGWVAIILVDPEWEYINHIRNTYLNGQAVKKIQVNNDIDLKIKTKMLIGEKSKSEAEEVFYEVLKPIQKDRHYAPLDDRIGKVIEHIKANDHDDINVKVLASMVFLSESRLQHLFKEQVGIPLKSYILWRKVLSAVSFINEGKSFTDAAHMAGFSDSAHLSRTFKDTFGVSLSEVLKKGNKYKVIV